MLESGGKSPGTALRAPPKQQCPRAGGHILMLRRPWPPGLQPGLSWLQGEKDHARKTGFGTRSVQMQLEHKPVMASGAAASRSSSDRTVAGLTGTRSLGVKNGATGWG